MATAEFSKFAGILSAALSQHHLSGFEIAPLEFHQLRLSAGNYVLILGLLHYHQLRSAWMAALGNWFSAKQIEMHFVLDHWQQGWSLTALWPVKLEPRPSVILQ